MILEFRVNFLLKIFQEKPLFEFSFKCALTGMRIALILNLISEVVVFERNNHDPPGSRAIIESRDHSKFAAENSNSTVALPKIICMLEL